MKQLIADAKKDGPIDQPHSCDFCGKRFVKESTLISHLCEPKRRFNQRGEIGPRIGLLAYQQFYQRMPNCTKQKTYDEFVKSSYYTAFVRFGWHVHSINAVSPTSFISWLLDTNQKLDKWCVDKYYQQYLLHHLKRENYKDALERGILVMDKWSKENNSAVNHYFRYASVSRICQDIANGKISPWLIYCSESGVEMLSRLDESQLAMIYDVIDPDYWNTHLLVHSDEKSQCRDILFIGGF